VIFVLDFLLARRRHAASASHYTLQGPAISFRFPQMQMPFPLTRALVKGVVAPCYEAHGNSTIEMKCLSVVSP